MESKAPVRHSFKQTVPALGAPFRIKKRIGRDGDTPRGTGWPGRTLSTEPYRKDAVMKATLSFASMPEGEELIDLNSLEDLVQIIERYREKVIVSLAHRKGATLSIVLYNRSEERRVGKACVSRCR